MGFSGSLDEDGGGGSSRAGFGIPCGKPPTAAAEPPNATRGCAPAAVQCFFVIVYGIRMLLSSSLTSFFLPFYHRRERNLLIGIVVRGSWMAYANGFDDTLAMISWYRTTAAASPIIQYSSSTPFSPTMQHRNSKGALSFSLLLWIHSF